MNDVPTYTGRCACGAVKFSIVGAASDVVACHCETCRRWSGYYWAATHVDKAALAIETGDALIWWASSDFAERGFCGRCGSSLFYRRHAADHIAIAPGALDGPTRLSTVAHICCAEAGDYYAIDPAAERHSGPTMNDD